MHQKVVDLRQQGRIIGLVPTMGALHEGHLTLVRRAKGDGTTTVVSIFVNPRQFNNPQDLATYPRSEEDDTRLLETEGVDYVFMPSTEDLYDDIEGERKFDFGLLDKVMEGKYRPGHFEGVAQVVSRFFDIIEPHRAYFGEKDFQQLTIIQHMVKMCNFSTEIIPVAIVREPSGLALSSRNRLISEEKLLYAPTIYKILQESKKMWHETSLSPHEVEQFVINSLNNTPYLRVEYFEIVDASSLQQIKNKTESSNPVGCVACFCGEVRLIDNIKYAE